jgi:prepilin-type N-terminal cleavage/methylation domain-containing protein
LSRRGFTLVELLIATIVAGILGIALARLLVNDSRFVARQEAMLSSRSTARTAMNWMATELRMISDSGLVSASTNSVTLRVPYAFGVICDRSSSLLLVSLMPTDSLTYANAVADGLAWRRSTGQYRFISGVGVSPSTDYAVCTADSVRVIPDGQLVGVSGTPAGAPHQPDVGSIGYLYQIVTYRFAASTDLPGRIGLWRQAGSGTDEELVAPFDTSAGFGFLVGSSIDALANPPADLSTVSGLELRLVGASEFTPRGSSGPQIFELATQLRFTNKDH